MATEKISFDEGLQRYLWRCELQYRAEHKPGGECVGWLAPMCDSVERIAAFLRELGFRVHRTVDEVDCVGQRMAWVETTSGLIVFVNRENLRGFICKSCRKRG